MTEPPTEVGTDAPRRAPDPSARVQPRAQPDGPDVIWLDALDLLVEEVVRFAGYDLAGIALVRDDELEWVSVCENGETGDPAGPAHDPAPPTGGREPLPPVLERLVREGTGSWLHQDAALVALQDDEQVLRGVLLLDRPRGGRPDGRRHQILEQYTAQARRAVLVALERESLGRRMTMARAARRAVRYATTRLSLESIAEECRESLAVAFRADEVWLRLAGSPIYGPLATTPTGTETGTDAAFQAMMLRLEQEA